MGKLVKLEGKLKEIHGLKEVKEIIRPEKDAYESYGLATVNSDDSTLVFLPCKPSPLIHKSSLGFSSSTEFDVYVNDSENKLWAISNNGSGDLIYNNENTGNTMVYQNVDLDSVDRTFRIEDKLENGYRLMLSKQKFNFCNFEFEQS